MNKLSIALGTFDGLHRGHINVLNEVKKFESDGYLPSMLLFDCHPQSVISGKTPPLLITSEDKIKTVQEMGIKPVPIKFSDICNLSAEEFVRDILIKKYNVGAVVSGENFRFGKNGTGNSQILYEISEKYGIIYKQARGVMFGGALISATRIRNALENGNVEEANSMLGRNFSYDFTVAQGNKIGKKVFGFPTINQHFPKDFIELRHGVYASETTVDGRIYPSVTNFGNHPTVGVTNALSETCILGFEGNLYDQKIRVELTHFLRCEKKFGSFDELKAQIADDSKKSVEIFNGKNIIQKGDKSVRF